MKADLVWAPPDAEGRQVKALVYVSPDELATLRYALAMDPERLGSASASLRTYNERGHIYKQVYILRYVLSVTPRLRKQAQEEK